MIKRKICIESQDNSKKSKLESWQTLIPNLEESKKLELLKKLQISGFKDEKFFVQQKIHNPLQGKLQKIKNYFFFVPQKKKKKY